MSIKNLVWVLLILTLVGLLMACQPIQDVQTVEPVQIEEEAEEAEAVEEMAEDETQVETPARGGNITVGAPQEPEVLVWPAGDFCWTCIAIMQTLWEPPLKTTEDGSLVPAMLETVPTLDNGGVSEDGKEITVKLREGIVWSDGEPITTEDLVFTWQYVIDPDSASVWTAGWEDIEEIETPDEVTAIIRLKEPNAAFVNKTLADHFASWLPKHVLEGTDMRETGFARAPTVSSGPFNFVEWVSGDHITVERNPNYLFADQGQPYLDKITFNITTDRNALLAALIAGQTDAAIILSEPDIVELEGVPGITVYAWPGLNKEMWQINQVDPANRVDPHPTLGDVRVRQAIQYGLDREAIARDLLFGQAEVGINFHKGSGWFDENLTVVPHDPELAKSLLEEAGWVDTDGDGIREKDGQPLSIRISTTAGRQLREDIGVVAQQQLKEVGIDLVIDNYRSSELFASEASGGVIFTQRFDIAQYGDSIVGSDPDISHFYWCDEEGNFGPSNSTRVCSPELNEALECQLRAFDREVRQECLDIVQQIVYDQVYTIFLYDRADVMAAKDELKGIRHSANPYAFQFTFVNELRLEE
jgi:peptide/nickel transport system substrate-binding protein